MPDREEGANASDEPEVAQKMEVANTGGEGARRSGSVAQLVKRCGPQHKS